MNPITFSETPAFLRSRRDLMDDAALERMMEAIALDPESGTVIPGTGGLRKLRWSRPGLGKRGGLRIIYYIVTPENVCILLMVYAKSQTGDLSPDARRRLVRAVEQIKGVDR